MFLRFFAKYIFFINLIRGTISENPLLMAAWKPAQIAKTAECVLKLSAKYFVEKKALSGSIVILNINSYASTTEEHLLKTINGGIEYSVMVKDSFYPHANASHFPEKAKNYMLILEDKSELKRNILQLNKLPTWNPLAKAIVLYQLNQDENGEVVAIDFINELRSFKLFRTTILINFPIKNEVVAYSWTPFSKTHCGGPCVSVYILDRCLNSVLAEEQSPKEMFPADLYGCPLVAYAVVSEPYVMPPVKHLNDAVYNDSYQFNDGAEIKLLQIIANFTNMTLITRMSKIPENWGNIYENGSAAGAYEILSSESADLVIGNIEVTRTIRKWFDPTVIYTQDEITWCVPKAKKAATWDNLVKIFQLPTWIITFASLLIMGLTFHLLHYIEKGSQVTKWPTKSLLMTFSMMLGWGASFNPKSATFRILIFGWLCFSINMGITYESFLRSFLMHPRFEKQISTETDLVQSEIPLGGREIYRSYFKTNNVSSFYLYRKYNSTTFAEGIRRVALHKNFAVVSSRRQAIYQDQKLGKGVPLIYCFPESNNLYKYGVVLLARKWFPMLDRFNSVIRSVSENGLIDEWSKKFFLLKPGADGASTILALSIQHLLGAFMFIGLMYCASVLLFIGEITFGFIGSKRDNVAIAPFKIA